MHGVSAKNTSVGLLEVGWSGGVVEVEVPPAQGRWGDAHVAPRADLCGEVSGVGADIGSA
jgi:hypothetical protein